MDERRDRIIGILIGLAAGDRIGGPIRMALRVAESLRDRGGPVNADIAARYLDWWKNGAFDTGPTVKAVLELVESGMPFEQASMEVHKSLGGRTAGCNPAHRAAPMAMCADISDSGLDSVAIAEAQLTHADSLAGEVSAAVVRLCRALVHGSAWREALEFAAVGRDPRVEESLSVGNLDTLSRGGFAPDVLRAAVHFVGTSNSFSEALARSIEFAGPPNYCPVLVGSIGGARWGRGQVEDAAFIHHGELASCLMAVANDLGKGWQLPEGPVKP